MAVGYYRVKIIIYLMPKKKAEAKAETEKEVKNLKKKNHKFYSH